MAQLPSLFVSHTQKVCRLYKKSLRALECYYPERDEFRYRATLLRERFEKNRHIPDARVAKLLLLEGEEELFNKEHPHKWQFPNSPGGIAYERFGIEPDGMLDLWDPMEKARYPKYFAKREELKKEYMKLYEKAFPPIDKKEAKKPE